MKYLILLFLIFLSSCAAKYAAVPLSKPPAYYYPNTNIQTQKEFLKEYQRSLIRIKEWQKWYNIQVGSNYFKFNKIL